MFFNIAARCGALQEGTDGGNHDAARSVHQGEQSLHSVGFFWTPVWGSDIEDAQDSYSEGSPGCQEKTFYPGGTENYNINSGEGTEVFGNCYKTIAICNSLIECFESLSNFSEIMTGEPNSLSNIYGQAVALRATMYYELIKWYGDVPHALKAGESAKGLTSRYAIYDYHIEKLMEVEPHMYRPGENGTRADVMNRSYVQGLIARMALYDGGYSTRRTDLGADFYVDGAGKVLTFDDWSVEKNHAIYGRRSDWKTVFEKAIPYLRSFMNDHGSIVLYTVDPRGKGPNGQEYDCPFQYTFEQMHADDGYTVADEAVYEIPFHLSRCMPMMAILWLTRPYMRFHSRSREVHNVPPISVVPLRAAMARLPVSPAVRIVYRHTFTTDGSTPRISVAMYRAQLQDRQARAQS